MSPLRFFGPLLAGRLSSRRIGSLHQTRHIAGSATGFAFSRMPRMVAAATLSSIIGGAICWYIKESGAIRLTDDEKAFVKQSMTEEEALKEDMMRRSFQEWKTEHGPTYKNDKEEALRYQIFKRNAQKTGRIGQDTPVRLNRFGDRAESELPIC